MNRDPVTTLTVSATPLTRVTRALAQGAALALLAALSACGGSGAPIAVNAQPPTSSAQSYTCPPPANADVQAFMVNLWENINPSNRCGGWHHPGGPAPLFARPGERQLSFQAR